MYNFTIYLLNGEEITCRNIYFSKDTIMSYLNDGNNYIKIDDYIIPKNEITYVKFFESEEK